MIWLAAVILFIFLSLQLGLGRLMRWILGTIAALVLIGGGLMLWEDHKNAQERATQGPWTKYRSVDPWAVVEERPAAMTPVTDPALLEQLDGPPAKPRPTLDEIWNEGAPTGARPNLTADEMRARLSALAPRASCHPRDHANDHKSSS